MFNRNKVSYLIINFDLQSYNKQNQGHKPETKTLRLNLTKDKQDQEQIISYADFEYILVGEDRQLSDGVRNVERHIPVAFSYYIKCSFNDDLDKFVCYIGDDVGKSFVDKITNDLRNIYHTHYLQKKLIEMSPSDVVAFNAATACYLCHMDLGNDRVRDHCHMTGTYRGAAHNECNLKCRVPKFIPIFFHNFTNYDSHLFIQHLSSIPGDINVIPMNKEKYISLSKMIPIESAHPHNLELRFLDSFRFMASSLDSLSGNLEESSLIATKKAYMMIF